MNNTFLGATPFLVQPAGTFKTPAQIEKEQAEAKRKEKEAKARQAGKATASFFENLFKKKTPSPPPSPNEPLPNIQAPVPVKKIPKLAIILGAVAVVGALVYFSKKK